MLTQRFSSHRKILLNSILVGCVIALLTGSLQLLMLHHQRATKLDSLTNGLTVYLANYFSDLKTTIDHLQPLALRSCDDVSSELTSRAAYTLNVRAFLLVKNHTAFCSSATRTMNISLSNIAPGLDSNKDFDMQLVAGTPIAPSKPSIVLWYRNPAATDYGVFVSLNISMTPYLLYTTRQEEFTGIALVVGHQALSTYANHLLNTHELPVEPARHAMVGELPLAVNVYAASLSAQNIQNVLLLSTVSGFLAGIICFYVLNIRLRPGKEILTAIRQGQFYVVYQPMVNAQTLQMSGVEVLMRWRHPIAGEIPPDAFIHFAEAQKLIIPLTLHLFQLIAKDAPVLQTLLPAGSKLGVNISPSHLHSANFQQDIRQFIAALPENYFHVVLEMTERDMLNQSEALRVFEWLHSEGLEIAIDDFGTGHSALIYLERFTMVDYLKIDRGFITAIGTETLTTPVLDAVLMLAKRLNMATIAEGIETPEQAKWLREHGVNYLQGYFISRPLTLAQFVENTPKPSVEL